MTVLSPLGINTPAIKMLSRGNEIGGLRSGTPDRLTSARSLGQSGRGPAHGEPPQSANGGGDSGDGEFRSRFRSR